jgi:uncharacterized protein (DUF2252 family)
MLHSVPVDAPRKLRRQQGKSLRGPAPRSSHAELDIDRSDRDPLRLLGESDGYQIPNLLPIRYGRMAQSPFAFLRGSAAVMAFDLARTPTSGIRVQACGDRHLMNFAAFATPERHLVFDINDFDETLPAPWEWDVKRLAASIWVAGRYRGFAERQCEDAVGHAVRMYREKMRGYAGLPALQVWYTRIDAEHVVEIATSAKAWRMGGEAAARAAAVTSARLLPKLSAVVDGKRRINDEPPLIFHVQRQASLHARIRDALRRYRTSLAPERGALLRRYHLSDVAMKVVGVGSVGTFCAIALLEGQDNDTLFLQIKQARRSVLEPYAGNSAYSHQGQRVVEGQRFAQAASDPFLGWARIGRPALDIYVRQLRDMKASVSLDNLRIRGFVNYVRHCAWATARAHAKTGDAAIISGYLGRRPAADAALTTFARAYADQTERDHATLVKAIRAGRIRAEVVGAD